MVQRHYLTVIGFAVLLVFKIDVALAFCSEPSFYASEPSAPSFGKPSVPYCLFDYKYSGEHTCDEWEIDGYISDINSYINDLRNYVEEANSFADSAAEFAQEAFEYAQCEAEEAKGELG